MSKNTTFSKTSIEGFQGVLATFSNVSGDVFTRATTSAADLAATLGGDITEQAHSLGRALNDPAEGVSKLAREGVTFTDQQKAQIKAMQQAGNLAGAQNVILNQLQAQYGGVAAAMAATPFGRLDQLANQTTDTFAAAGQSIALVGARLATAFHVGDLLSSVQAGFTRLQPIIAAALDTIQPYIEAFVPKVVNAFWGIVGGVESVFGSIYGVVAPVVTGVFNYITSVWGSITGATSAAFAATYGAIADVFGAIYGFIAPIVTSIYDVITSNWEPIVDVASEVFTAVASLIESVLGAAWTFVSGTAAGLADAWTSAMNLIGVSTTTTGSQVTDIFTGIGAAAKWLADLVSGTLTLISFGFDNMGLIVAGALVASAYELVKFGNQIGYVFGDVIGGYLGWLGTNWSNVFLDIVNFTQTVFSNLLTNAENFGSALWEAVKGNGFKFDWTPLTDGFKSAVTELPKIADRQAGPLEKSLGDQADTISNELQTRLGNAFNNQDDKAKAMSGAIKDVFKGVGADVQKAFDAKPPQVKPTVVVPKPQELKINNTKANAALDETKQKGQDLAAVFSNSAESAQSAAALAFQQVKYQSQQQAAGVAGATQATPSPVATPNVVPAPASVTNSARQDDSKNDLMAQLVSLVQLILNETKSIDSNTAGGGSGTLTLADLG